MKCPFCAEEIQDAAVLCRFCGARKHGEQWQPPGEAVRAAAVRPKGAFTIKSTGVLFLLSGVWSLGSLTSAVPLFGAMRGGSVAIGYNLLFAGLFAGIGIGLIARQWWGYQLLLAGTALYSVDKLLFVLDQGARKAYLAASGVTQQVQALVDVSMLDQMLIVATLTTVACWWGFAIYIYIRRDYFLRSAPDRLGA